MKQKTFLLVLATCLGVLMLCQVALVAAERAHGGHNIGNMSFSAPITAEDATYLGLAGPAAFSPERHQVALRPD